MKQDARTLNPQTQEQIRRQAIRLREKCIPNKEVAQIVGVHYKTTSRWWQTYQAQGMSSMKCKKRGKPLGTNRTLGPGQEKHIQKKLTDRTPGQVKLPFTLWNRRAVIMLIEQELGIKMPIRTVGEYLSRWGFTPQKPLKRAYEQRPKEVKQWLDKSYPQIAERVKSEDAEIHWVDVTGIRSDRQYGRSYSPKGKTLAVKPNTKRQSLNMISSVTNQGKVRFMLSRNSVDDKILIKFFTRLLKSSNRKCFVILDNLHVHHAKVVNTWLAANEDTIEVFYLPSYSPELNPGEYLDCDLNIGARSKPPAKTHDQIQSNVKSYMIEIQKSPDRVKAYFKHHKIADAA